MQACRLLPMPLLPILPPRRRHRTVMENFGILGTCTLPSHLTPPALSYYQPSWIEIYISPCLLRTNSTDSRDSRPRVKNETLFAGRA